MSFDDMLHDVQQKLPFVRFRPVEKGNGCMYYYAEKRLYVLRYPDGSIRFSFGSSPKSAFDAAEKLMASIERRNMKTES